LDDISGLGQTEALHKICGGVVDSEQKHLIVEGAGHYGIFSGRRWREVVYPELQSFIASHHYAAPSTPGVESTPVKATTAAAAKSRAPAAVKKVVRKK
jgi:poly(3-hydroxybutyrate) depolymerase